MVVSQCTHLLADGCILVLEMYDRSLSQGSNATVHPTDTEILKLFWSDWLDHASNATSFAR